MGQISIKGFRYGYTVIPDNSILKCLKEADGNTLKVFLALFISVKNNEPVTTSSVALMCSLTEVEVISSVESLDSLGLLKITGLDVEGNLDIHETEASDTNKAVKGPVTDFKDLFREAESINGGPLSPKLLILLGDLVTVYGLTSGAVLKLFAWCRQRDKANVPYIEAVAANWKERGIITEEKAEDEIRSNDEKWKNYRDLLRYMGEDSFQIPEPLEKVLDKWYGSYGFSHEMIKIAAERCVLKLKKADLKYMDGILTNWKNLGVRTPQDIEKMDPKKEKRQKQKTSNSDKTPFTDYKQKDYDYSELERKVYGLNDRKE